ncbi:hypothetical protein D3C79_1052900 [compost metagenome]
MQVNLRLVKDDQRPFLEVGQRSRNEVGKDGLPGTHGGRQVLLKLLNVYRDGDILFRNAHHVRNVLLPMGLTVLLNDAL